MLVLIPSQPPLHNPYHIRLRPAGEGSSFLPQVVASWNQEPCLAMFVTPWASLLLQNQVQTLVAAYRPCMICPVMVQMWPKWNLPRLYVLEASASAWWCQGRKFKETVLLEARALESINAELPGPRWVPARVGCYTNSLVGPQHFSDVLFHHVSDTLWWILVFPMPHSPATIDIILCHTVLHQNHIWLLNPADASVQVSL